MVQSQNTNRHMARSTTLSEMYCSMAGSRYMYVRLILRWLETAFSTYSTCTLYACNLLSTLRLGHNMTAAEDFFDVDIRMFL
jgi:hypothetical protein